MSSKCAQQTTKMLTMQCTVFFTVEIDLKVVCTCMEYVQLLGINTVLHVDYSDLSTSNSLFKCVDSN